jgi:hypothetical protein
LGRLWRNSWWLPPACPPQAKPKNAVQCECAVADNLGAYVFVFEDFSLELPVLKEAGAA